MNLCHESVGLGSLICFSGHRRAGLADVKLYLAFRDREAGRHNNRSKNTEEEGAAPREGYEGRGGRGGRGGGRGGRRDYDRHSATGKT
jgi:hypothetical protein